MRIRLMLKRMLPFSRLKNESFRSKKSIWSLPQSRLDNACHCRLTGQVYWNPSIDALVPSMFFAPLRAVLWFYVVSSRRFVISCTCVPSYGIPILHPVPLRFVQEGRQIYAHSSTIDVSIQFRGPAPIEVRTQELDKGRGKWRPQSPFYVVRCSIMVLTLYEITLF